MTATAATRDLLSHHSGRALFRCVGGVLQHLENVFTVEIQKSETVEAFIARLGRDHVRDGDDVELLNNGGRVTVARITRRS